jgi:type II secretory pathway component PulK
VMAARIIAARPFRSADDLKKVNGIGDKKYETIRPYLSEQFRSRARARVRIRKEKARPRGFEPLTF